MNRSLIISSIVIGGGLACLTAIAQSTPVATPLPAEAAAAEFQRGAEAWINTLKNIGLILAPILAGAGVWIYTQIDRLKAAHERNELNIQDVKGYADEALSVAHSAAKQSDIDVLHERVNSATRIATDALQSQIPATQPPNPPQTPTVPTLVAGLLVACLFFTGCANLTAQQKQDAWNEVYSTALAAGDAYLSGEKGQAVSSAVFAAATTGQPVQQLVQDAVTMNGGTVAQAATLNSAIQTGLAISKASTPAQKVTALNTIGSALQLVANQEFAK